MESKDIVIPEDPTIGKLQIDVFYPLNHPSLPEELPSINLEANGASIVIGDPSCSEVSFLDIQYSLTSDGRHYIRLYPTGENCIIAWEADGKLVEAEILSECLVPDTIPPDLI